MLKIGKSELGRKPRIAITVTDREDSPAIKAAHPDILEIRIDQFRKLGPDYVRNIITSKRKAGLPLILTVRSQEEGGQRRISDKVKLDFFRANISLVDAVDIELKSPLLNEIIHLAKKNKKISLISWHNFKATPDEQALSKILLRAKKKGGDIVKIAAWARTMEDVIRLARWTLENKARNLITISLGGLGSISRLLFPLLGSLITYAYIRKPIAPGQIPLEELREHLRLYYSGKNAKEN